MTRFQNRRQAGRLLADALQRLPMEEPVLVLGLPRGGLPVAAEIAEALDAPLDVCVVRKLGVPGQEELAFGAIASGGARVFNDDVIDAWQLSPDDTHSVIQHEQRELRRRELAFRGDHPFPKVAGHTVIVADDGAATGATMRAAVAALRRLFPRRIIAAVPVASHDAITLLRQVADDCIVLSAPEPFYGVGLWYDDFAQTSDKTVRALLEDARKRDLASTRPGAAIGEYA
ncbi:MAG: phosphoribosyltransferase [Gemmatimonadaceae bacterium]